VQDRVRDGRECEQQARGEDAAAELEGDRAREEAAQLSPVLARRETEAELHEGLLNGQVEQALGEGRRGEDEGVAAERLRGEDVQGDDGRAKAERR
jgi:hypothetical protein